MLILFLYKGDGTVRVWIYDHYDVIAAENENNLWGTDPFNMTGRNGYLYGRGTSDNKGPILASIFAVNELLKEGLLDVNAIFLIESEEESGRVGFYEAVILLLCPLMYVYICVYSNSYWLGEDVPCITYGLRGVIHATVSISNKRADLHSGIEGGAVSEPLIDLIHVLGKLVDNNKKVLIPGFYDNVSPMTEAEEKLYDPIVEWTQTSETARSNKLKQQLMARWRYSTLTVHKIDVSINNPTLIPRNAKAAVSMRVAPDQAITDICAQFEQYVKNVFAQCNSDNRISITIESAAEYWLGDLKSKYFKAVANAIADEWNMKLLYIREGGSIPAVRWLDPYGARSIGSVSNPNTAYRRLNSILTQNNVCKELRANRYFGKPHVTRRRKNIERNRKLFGAMIGKKAALIK
ncbi:uncharacterized protein EV154DRAFT_420013 [Mucor mucedo]|uniref:uncharacterized protein n=1 Tax=Mucor mucedo TaxID=29922 RepID=UPI00221FD6D6|nr:uncharacterized protein EV154DRAFT_420013 [Mucor mucedo]KAI7891619.1 hypothetical protein EV154DRAFT_420013 [Mucor mucedo]